MALLGQEAAKGQSRRRSGRALERGAARGDSTAASPDGIGGEAQRSEEVIELSGGGGDTRWFESGGAESQGAAPALVRCAAFVPGPDSPHTGGDRTVADGFGSTSGRCCRAGGRLALVLRGNR